MDIMEDIITVQDAVKKTGLSTCTIIIHAQKKNQPMIGKGMYRLTPEFLEYLKTIKSRNRRKK